MATSRCSTNILLLRSRIIKYIIATRTTAARPTPTPTPIPIVLSPLFLSAAEDVKGSGLVIAGDEGFFVDEDVSLEDVLVVLSVLAALAVLDGK